MNMSSQHSSQLLLSWYWHHQRTLPWRITDPQKRNPYVTWISEIMLQQTTVGTTIPYFNRFISRFPNIKSLAEASEDDVLYYWAGLGYYRRARLLHKTARILNTTKSFPSTPGELEQLPGIGSYTAKAIAAIAFNKAVIPVDGNVERVLSRLYAIKIPIKDNKKQLNQLATTLNQDKLARQYASDFAQALFDLGATICRPRHPLCQQCPWHHLCKAYESKNPENYPPKPPRKKQPQRYRISFLAIDENHNCLFIRRPDEGLLAKTYDLPSTPMEASKTKMQQAQKGVVPFKGDWRSKGWVKHVFTHFTLWSDIRMCHLQTPFPKALHHHYHITTTPTPCSRLTQKCIEQGLTDKEIYRHG